MSYAKLHKESKVMLIFFVNQTEPMIECGRQGYVGLKNRLINSLNPFNFSKRAWHLLVIFLLRHDILYYRD